MVYHTNLPTNPWESVDKAKDFLHDRCTQRQLVQQRCSFMPVIWARVGLVKPVCSDVVSLFSFFLDFIPEVVKYF